MKPIHKITFFFISFFLTSAALFAQESKGYEITGHISGLKDGTKITMNRMDYLPGEAVEVPVDSAYVKNGEFHITGVVSEGPRIYWLRFGAVVKVFRMFIDNGQHIVLDCSQDIAKIPHSILDDYITCSGSPTHYAYKLFERYGIAFDVAMSSYNHTLKEMQNSVGYDSTAVKYFFSFRHLFMDQIYIRQLNPIHNDLLPAAAFFALYEAEDHSPFWKDIYNQLDDHQKASIFGKKLKLRLPLLEGEQMPPFSLPDPSGKPVSLGEIVKSGKVTLVRFWATNSYRRQEMDKELRAMYKLYHSKGLNIVAVSTDSFDEQWKQALAKENYPWANLFDKRGEKVADPVYHELGRVDHQNTTNVILDAQGKIVAWDPTGIELQYYILKALGE